MLIIAIEHIRVSHLPSSIGSSIGGSEESAMNALRTLEGTIHYEVTGRGPAVVFLHSALADHRQWRVQVEALAQGYRCIAYDLMGYGQSDNAPERYDPADTLVALLDDLGVETATLVGSSLGGSVAIHAAVKYPHRIRSMVVAGTGLFGFEPPNLEGPKPPIYAQYEAALAAHDVNRLVDLAEAIWLRGIDGSDEDVPFASREAFRLMYREFLNTRGEFLQYPELNDVGLLRNLEIPIMVLLGERETAFCVAIAEHLEATLSRVTLVRMTGAAHFPNLSRPHEVTDRIRRWLHETSV